MNALIIDDSRAMRTILRHILTELGFQTHEAINGKEGLDAVAKTPALDIVFVDWNMPVMNGLEFVTALRGDANRTGLPVVMVTTESEMDFVMKALEAGANEYIMKPFDRQIVSEKLQLLGIAVG